MIDLKYKLSEEDFLQLNLYHFDVEKSFKKNSQKVIVIFLIIISILLIYFFYKNEKIYSITLALVAFFILIFHKRNMKSKFKKMFKKNIQQYKNRFDKIVELRITENEIEVKSVAGNTQFYKSQIKNIIETKDYFFIRLQPEAIVIPKRELENENKVSENLTLLSAELKVEFKKNLEWKW